MTGATLERLATHRRLPQLEEALATLNGLLAPIEQDVIAEQRQPRFPVVFIMGVARSGSTLVLQWLAQTGLFGYPTNMLSRFFRAPAIGAMVQQIFTEYDVREEILGPQSRFEFESNLGKTQGPMAPNEFWYFWRRFFEFGEIQKLDESKIDHDQLRRFTAELAAMESVLQKPLAMKGMILNWDILLLNQLLDHAIFLFVRRDEYFNAQSLLFAREKFFGDRQEWYSFKPPEYSRLRELSPAVQVTGQVYFTNRAIENALRDVDEHRQLIVDYDAFCRTPESVYSALIDKLKVGGVKTEGWTYSGPTSFPVSSEVRLTASEEADVREALERFKSEGIPCQ
ncbi:MAG: sulfotransferase [Planctomycetaceae bacterium]|nr:sulfotransferase [Planctomycetaceae bacterium]MCA9108621.1 sulfotransferase [Planctomycetaceae bacterium]